MIDVAGFIRDGFVKLERPRLRKTADAARARLWQSMSASPDDSSTWTRSVVWTSDFTGDGPFQPLVHSPELTGALDQICGVGGWKPRNCLGNIPVRFPVSPSADDRGWHVDANTPVSDGSWTVTGRPHTMLILTLLSDVSRDDAPTRIRVGSHRDAKYVVDPQSAASDADLVPRLVAASADRPVGYATGSPGDVYLVHPFCVHAADEHRGATPRFMAQAPIELTQALTPESTSPLAAAVWH